VPAMAGTRIRVPLGQQIGVTDGRGTVVQILGKFVVIACHRAEGLAKGIIEGRFGELSYFLCPRATVRSCVHASQTVSLAARFRVEVTLLWKNATRTVLAGHPGSFASARVCPSDKNLVTALFTRAGKTSVHRPLVMGSICQSDISTLRFDKRPFLPISAKRRRSDGGQTTALKRHGDHGPFEAEQDKVHSMIFIEEWETTRIALDED
jgi:hypothetical protein